MKHRSTMYSTRQNGIVKGTGMDTQETEGRISANKEGSSHNCVKQETLLNENADQVFRNNLRTTDQGMSTDDGQMTSSLGDISELCQVCLNGFTTLSKMKEHMVTHSDYKPHQCSHCSAAFKRRSDLKRHLRQHTGEKPFACPLCDYACTQSTALQQHMLRRHKGEEPYQCSKCNVGFHRATDWKKHMATHKLTKPETTTEVKGTQGIRMQ